jgi:hypothetical protein
VASSRVRFPKPIYLYTVLSVFGSNIVASEGEQWKRYRTVTAPAFSEVCNRLLKSPFSQCDPQRNTRLVWDETIRIMFDLFDNVWGDSPEIVLDHCVEITLPVGRVETLPHNFSDFSVRSPFLSSASQVVYIYSSIAFSCSRDLGFGRRVTWTSDLIVPPGHQMTFKDALHVLSSNLIFKIALPKWSMHLTERLRRINLAFDEMKVPCPARYLLCPRLTHWTAIYGRNGE